ncbi:lipase [Thalassotalea sp. 1_MG-2023]|uniref:VolA/Pla-1 family phospholipase n=1 Tax=Thalassotalea sp. 1_MG-2023 TaxID=3062680 RepID=UPI0026E40F9C|nr:VolA/Pla-1 family phospholipase [Thalassotalea sp. 1_MG-2023]MDO6427851.1 lipase [Thalassotalea sp. 1_MG-2023]
MKKLVLSLAIASTLGLAACDSETVKDVKKDVASETPAVITPARIVFDPASGIEGLSVPNDLIFSGSIDGTLEIPVEDPTDGSDPFVAASALDGWSTVNPFVINIDMPEGRMLDGDSVFNPSSVRVFETIMGGDTTDADCAAVERGLACKVVKELTYLEDFVTQKSGNSIAFVPLKPLKGKTTYVFALTNSLQDSDGNAIAGSTTYELARQDINEKPLGSESQLVLQGVINSYEKAVVSAGVTSDDIIYTMAMTTQSTTDVLFTLKSLMANNLQQGIYPSIAMSDTGMSVADVLAGQIPPQAVPLYSAANYMKGSITLPYYSGVPSADNPTAPANTWWTALCDSAAMLAGLAAQNPAAIPAEPISPTDAQCMAISQASGLPAPGLRDLGIDTERNLTKYNPVPKVNAMMPLEVQMTTPDLAWVNPVRASMGMDPITEPAEGWPVVILQHGITTQKEVMLNLTGMLAVNGLATVAIDYPIHGTRGFNLDGAPGDEINATTVSALHYMNLGSMLTMRDNTRQSAIDLLGVRLGLNFFGGVDSNGNAININSNEVHFLGHSLGAIYGINAVTLANTPLAPTFDPLLNITSNILAMPGLMLANFGIESPAFEGLAKSNLAYSASEDFKNFVDMSFPTGYTQEQLTATYEQFYAGLTAAQQAELDAVFAQFTLIAQTVTDSGDPVNFVQQLAATGTPTLLFEIVGNGMDNLPDQVVTNTAPFTPLGGTEPAIALLGLPGVNETTQGSGAVRFLYGHHGSLLDPRANAASPDEEKSAAVMTEMQRQLISFILSKGQMIQVENTELVK